METKSDKVRAMVSKGDYKGALALVKTFKLGFTKEEKETLVRAFESQWNPEFYKKMGYDPEALFTSATIIINRVYG